MNTDPPLTPRDIANHLGVSVDKVRHWIRVGELEAINTSLSTRPKYKILPEAYERFLASRSTFNSAAAAQRPAIKQYV